MPTITHCPDSVIVHPLVLLSVVDHYSRVAENTKKRVVGVLLGQNNSGGSGGGKSFVNVANSFALPFEEDERDPSVWFLDHNYLESMWEMFKKVNASEKIIGWYHSGPKLRASDLEINQLMKRYCSDPILVVIDVEPKDAGLPTDAYIAVDEIRDDGTTTSRTFNHIHSEIQAEEAEEVGVEHLLRDVKDNAVGSLSQRLSTTFSSLRSLHHRLRDIHTYLEKVVAGQLPVNHDVMYNLQNISNLLPNLTTSTPTNAESFLATSNDRLLVVFLASLSRALIALHRLIDNKAENQEDVTKVTNSDKSTESKASVGAEVVGK